ncbi:MAG TPA: glycine betaine ABC transporter substrate-binding protein [Rhodothermales bacterium]|nr:glycine betaine ABC transporter substrate-binding protein [Rhodothermales bacterium]
MLLICFGYKAAAAQDAVTVGSKIFTESVILGDMAEVLIEDKGVPAQHRQELGGTRFLWAALLSGEIDIYPEYTGTVLQEIYAGRDINPDNLHEVLRADGVAMTTPLGFNNTYAVGMQRNVADSLGIHSISDLRAHPNVTLGFSNEFIDRGDGWPGMRRAYNLPHTGVRGMDHDLSYQALMSGAIDATDLYSTDAEIRHYDLLVLEDDLEYFPAYEAVYLYRLDMPVEAISALDTLTGAISVEEMISMNARASIDRTPEWQIAADFLRESMGLSIEQVGAVPSFVGRIWQHTKEHLFLVAISLVAAMLVAIPLGVIAAKVSALEKVILGTVGVIYTIPSLALLVFMIPLLGIGGPPAMVALFLYSLLPIVRNTHAGLNDIPRPLLESAEALGLPSMTRLRQIELPLAARSILAGIQTSAVINVGTATLGALIGAGGYGQPILTGIRLDDTSLILQGAIPAAVLALLVQGLFDLAERVVVAKGLRL